MVTRFIGSLTASLLLLLLFRRPLNGPPVTVSGTFVPLGSSVLVVGTKEIPFASSDLHKLITAVGGQIIKWVKRYRSCRRYAHLFLIPLPRDRDAIREHKHKHIHIYIYIYIYVYIYPSSAATQKTEQTKSLQLVI